MISYLLLLEFYLHLTFVHRLQKVSPFIISSAYVEMNIYILFLDLPLLLKWPAWYVSLRFQQRLVVKKCMHMRVRFQLQDLFYLESQDSVQMCIRDRSRFVPAGQSTQMIIGASGESDFHLLSLTQQLYQQYDMKRVFYSAYVPLNDDPELPAIGTAPPLLREHRLYQADWLLRYYGFKADELLSSDRPNFNTFVDPKCDWALRHLEYFPVEINQASYEQLLRVPGIGNKLSLIHI